MCCCIWLLGEQGVLQMARQLPQLPYHHWRDRKLPERRQRHPVDAGKRPGQNLILHDFRVWQCFSPQHDGAHIRCCALQHCAAQLASIWQVSLTKLVMGCVTLCRTFLTLLRPRVPPGRTHQHQWLAGYGGCPCTRPEFDQTHAQLSSRSHLSVPWCLHCRQCLSHQILLADFGTIPARPPSNPIQQVAISLSTAGSSNQTRIACRLP